METEFIEEGKSIEDIIEMYASVIKKYTDINKDVANELMLQFSEFLLKQSYYEYSIMIWDNLLDKGYKQDEVVSMIENEFIRPYEEDLKKTYINNVEKYKGRCYDGAFCDFEQLRYRLLPVDKNVYYVWDREKCNVLGKTEMIATGTSDENLEGYDTILFFDGGDFFAPISVKKENKEEFICIVSKDNWKFCYLMFPEFEQIFGERWRLFDSVEKIREFYHRNKSNSLPVYFSGSNDEIEKYTLWLDEEHLYRCSKEGRSEENILLTIGIPSFNRGHRALENIRRLQKLPYDCEVEFLVVNNCSIVNTEGYDEIEKLQETDKRITYYKFPDKPGMNSSGFEVLRRAKGQFCCLLSDEDHIVLENVTKYLKIIQKYGKEIGFIQGAGGHYYSYEKRNEKIEPGEKVYARLVWNLNYISGLIFNTKLWKEKNFDTYLLEKGENNDFVLRYAYNVAALYICLEHSIYFCKEQLFIEGEEDKQSRSVIINDGKKTLIYASPEKRIEQFEGCLEVLLECKDALSVDTVLQVYSILCSKIFYLLDVYREIYGEDVCDFRDAYERVLRVEIINIENLNVDMNSRDYASLIEKIFGFYQYSLQSL